ncbi:MAG: polyribonucleotide nucleotidyltransferase [Flavobacteriales bacterium]|nr:polyribonucleotide nucleotidyltransferase [Flavobacteriales bacterium]MCB9448485.1 polyribonucleotide nucleotidyltransferase [Flavobacteriales bacterium]
MLNVVTKTISLGDGRSITIETGKLAKQADGSVVVRMGDTMLLATVVSNKDAAENPAFFPLSVEYREQFASAGKIPGGFFKREARPSEHEILVCRLVDRALRPLFPDNYFAETQIIINLISAGKDTTPDSLACLAAASALAVSDIPFNGPVSEVRVARVNGQLVINPSISQLADADMDLMVGATDKDICMVEGEMKEVSEQDMVEALKLAHDAIKQQCAIQVELAAAIEKAQTKRDFHHQDDDKDLHEQVRKATYQDFYNVAKSAIASKSIRKEKFGAIREAFVESFKASCPEEELSGKERMIGRYLSKVEKEAVRRVVLDERQRLDGRKTDEIRPIWTEVDYLPSAHGSAIFTRGETQSLTSVTLGTKLDEQIIDGAIYEGKNNFMLHYNFPPYSTGEVKRMGSTSRREVGHGNLAHRALKGQMPKDIPYTVRVVSDILESNGSSSMATVCAGTLALMDAGVKLKKPVSGIAMGLIMDEQGKYAVLSDILGDEDHLGDMDFKVCGTRDGITACQMDIKVDGLSYEILMEALNQAKAGRMHILGKMGESLTEARADYKPHAPRIVQINIPKEFIGAVIGPGGKIIQDIQEKTGTTIVIEEVDGRGIVDISGDNKEAIDQALNRIKQITTVPEVGEVYKGKVKTITAFGAFVEILPGKDGLLHISEIDWKRLETVESALKEGDEVEVKIIGIDPKTGKIKLSRKVLLPKPEKQQQQEQI